MKVQFRFQRVLHFLFLFMAAGGFYRCANVMAPTGGPKDITPPKIVEAVPPNHSTRFTGTQFSLTFDEYVHLDKINQQLLISPPMAKMPDFKLKRKTLIVRFKEPLKPHTTYSVFFGDAIQDVDENNPLHDFTYVFSTGSTIDSMSLRGRVLGAEDLKPAAGVFVMLYKNNNDTIPLDSLPLRVKPYYLSKTNKQGYFQFAGLADTAYLLFALKDENNNMIYDQPGESIAFLDTLVRPQYRPVPRIDSVLLDSLTVRLPSDSAQMVADSLWKVADSVANARLTLFKLYLFREPDSVLKLMKAALIRPNTLQFVFNIPAQDVSIRSLNYHPQEEWHKEEWSPERDTLLWYLRLPHPDTLDLLVMHRQDTLGNLTLRVVPKEKFSRKKKRNSPPKKTYLSWKANHSGNIKPGDRLVLAFGQPVEKVISDSILLVQGKDTVFSPPFTFLDSLHRRMFFPMKIKDDEAFRLLLPDSTVIDWNGFFNNKINLVLHSKPLKDYSDLNVTLEPSKAGHYIFEILNDREKPLAIRYFSGAVTLHFPRIDPGKYIFKIIYDRNGNRRWDPGNYLKKQLPEKVIYFKAKGMVQLRANWEVNEKWAF